MMLVLAFFDFITSLTLMIGAIIFAISLLVLGFFSISGIFHIATDISISVFDRSWSVFLLTVLFLWASFLLYADIRGIAILAHHISHLVK